MKMQVMLFRVFWVSIFWENYDLFNDRFADFDLLKPKVKFFNNPVETDVESQPSYI